LRVKAIKIQALRVLWCGTGFLPVSARAGSPCYARGFEIKAKVLKVKKAQSFLFPFPVSRNHSKENQHVRPNGAR
jgi:hypothetical protein